VKEDGERARNGEWLPRAHGEERGALQGRVTRGLGWTFLDQWGRQLLNLIVFIVIARLVAPEDIGVVALATVFVAFAQIFIDAGLGDALVQRRVLTRAHIDTAFWISVGTGAALAAGVILLAIPLGVLLGEPRVTPVLQVLSISFVLYAASSIQMSLLRRELALRSLAIRALLAVGGGAAVGITLAFLGFGPWALVGQQLAAATLSVLTLWRVSPWRPGGQVSRAHFRELFGFGLNIVGTDILTFLSKRTDNLLVGLYLGTAALGFYTVAYRILDSSQALLAGIGGKVAFPAFSQLQHDRVRLGNAFLRVSRVTSAFVMPGFVALALVAPELIVVLFGARWAEAGPPAAALFAVGIAYAIGHFSGAALNAAGHPEITFRYRLVSTLTNVVGFFIAAALFGSIVAVAFAYTARAYLLLPLNLYLLRRYVGVPLTRFVRELSGILLGTAALALAVLAVKFVLGGDVPLAAVLAAEVLAGSVAFVVVFAAADRPLLGEIIGLLLQALPGRRATRASRRQQRAEVETDEDRLRQPQRPLDPGMPEVARPGFDDG